MNQLKRKDFSLARNSREHRAAAAWLKAADAYDAALAECHRAQEAAEKAEAEKCRTGQELLAVLHHTPAALVVNGRLIVADVHLIRSIPWVNE